MESLRLLQWTLFTRLEGGALEFSLGDGHRLAWRVRRPAQLVLQPPLPSSAELLFGAEFAGRLASSAPRPLGILYDADGPLENVDWEQLDLGGARLAEHFSLGRQLQSESDTAPPPAVPLAETLLACVVHGAMGGECLLEQRVAFDALGEDPGRQKVADAHVLALEGVPLGLFLQRAAAARKQRLLVVVAGVAPTPAPMRALTQALDTRAAVLCLAHRADLIGDTLRDLVRQLASGLSVGEAVRGLHRRAAPALFQARLYGDPEMRFVRPQLPTSRRQVTSLSFDLVDSTNLLTALGDESYAETLADVHARCTDIVRSHGGQPDDPQGDDGVMSYFGHPAAIEDAAVRAVEAGVMIVRTVAELGVVVRVGIATGPVAVKHGQPVGLSVHLAARLQQSAAPGTVQASHATRQLVSHAFDLAQRPDRPFLKGISPEEALYVVIGPRRDIQEHRLERVSALTPLVGRQAELARLHDCWHHVQAAGSALVVVRAEAGMGKSRLVREFRRQLVESGTHVLECRCRADANASPFLTLAESLRRWLHIGSEDSAALALQKLAAAVPGHARDGEPLALLADILGLAAQPHRQVLGSTRQRLLGLMTDWFRAFSGGQACCLIVEDWHWVDPSMRQFVERLVGQAGGPGLMVVITERSDVPPPALACAVLERIELGALAPESARQLVQHVCAGAPLSPRLVTLLAARGDGVPLFLEEAARMALERGAEGASEDYRRLESVPASLQDLLTARLDGLGAAKPVAQVAAVLGRHFTRAQLAALLDAAGHALDAAALDDRLAALADSGLVRHEGDGRWVFRHALIRDAAYTSLWLRDRQALHERVVELLQTRWPERAALQPELLALHLTEAGLHAQALAQWEKAASHAAGRSAELEAISHLRRALGALARTEAGVERDRTALRLQLLLAARLLATEGYGADAVLQAYLEAECLCDRIGDRTGDRMGDDSARFKVEMGLEAYRFMRADFEPALAHGRRAAAMALRSGDLKQRLNAHWGLACTLFHQGQLRATMREMDTALALYRHDMHPQFGIQDPGVMCMAYSSWGLWELGRPDAALERINRAVDLTGAFGHRFSQAVALAYGVSVQLLRGATEAALVRAEQCLRVCQDSGFPVWEAITRCMRGYLLCERGDFDLGLPEMSAGHAQWLATGALVSQPLYLCLQVQGLMLAGQWDTAAQRADQGLELIHRYGERQLEAELTRLHGELALQRGERDQAEAWFKRAYALALRQHKLAFALRSATALARLWAATGQAPRARHLLAPLLARWQDRQEGRGTRDVMAAAALMESLSGR